MKQRILFILVVGCLIGALGTALFAEDIEVKALISADKIGLDDMLVYTVTFKGINNPSQPDLSHFTDFKVAQTSRSTEFRFINGVSSYYTNFLFYLAPIKTGTFTLPPVTYTYNGKEYKTQPFRVEVVKGSAAPSGAPQKQRKFPTPFDMDEDFFSSPFKPSSRKEEIDIKIVPNTSKRNAYKGEQVTFKILLYTRNRIQGINMVSNSSLPGFWQEWFPMAQSIEGHTQTIDGKVYQVYEVRKAALFPTQSGALTIPALKFEMRVINDAFFPDVSTVSRSSAPLSFQVSELPPQASGLPVGHFTFQVTTDKKQIDVNDMLTLKIKIAGTGNIKTVNVPEMKTANGFKLYPPKLSNDVSFQADSVYGVLAAEIPVSFNRTGLITLAPLEFRYFDPSSSKVITLNSQPLAISVTGVKEKQESAATLPTTEIIKRGEDIDFIKKGDIYDQNRNLYHHPAFVLLLLLPFVINGLFILKRLVFDRYISQSEFIKKHKLINRTIKHLRDVQHPGEISVILESYLTEKTGMGLSEMNNRNIDQLLNQYGVDPDDINAFISIKNESESSRFSPEKGAVSGDGGDMRLKKDIDALIELLKRMDGRLK
ncbi:MAG: BatD family protein [Candidatus Omnitrophota bacterium]